MTAGVARPDAADLVMRTYGRALHPELLCHHTSTAITAQGMHLDIRLIPAGHALVLRIGSQFLTEVISDKHEVHPVRGRLFEHRVKGFRSKKVEFETGLRYDVCCSLEQLNTAVYLRQHEEFVADGAQASLYAEFPGRHRFSPGPLSVVRAEVCRHSIVIHAFHTFPEQLAIVKTQSLFEIGEISNS